ncbi:MAG: hypothetical protein HY000_04365, partial [Planctomycetes bacterium]|nr:hypothetical protein [Planctomycetota bacterium]
MPKIIVIDWCPPQVCILEAEKSAGRIQVQRLTSLGSPGPEESADSHTTLNALSQALLGSAKDATRVVGLVGRSLAVIRPLRVANCPAEELPGIVRFQAMRELAVPVEQVAIDFEVTGSPDDDGTQRVLLATLPQDVVARYRAEVAAARLDLTRLGLRPYAAWRAYTRACGAPSGPVLIVSLVGQMLELTVGRGDRVLFSHATLLRGAFHNGGTAFDPSTALVGEVRRAFASVASQIADNPVERIAFAACAGEHEQAITTLTASFSVPVDRFDPFQSVELSPGLHATASGPSTRSAAFVAAVGAALSADEPWPIDFLNPKKPVVQRNRRRPLVLLAAAATVLVAAAGYVAVHQQLAAGIREIVRLT